MVFAIALPLSLSSVGLWRNEVQKQVKSRCWRVKGRDGDEVPLEDAVVEDDNGGRFFSEGLCTGCTGLTLFGGAVDFFLFFIFYGFEFFTEDLVYFVYSFTMHEYRRLYCVMGILFHHYLFLLLRLHLREVLSRCSTIVIRKIISLQKTISLVL